MLPRNLQSVVCFSTCFALCLLAALGGPNLPAFALVADGLIARLCGILLESTAAVSALTPEFRKFAVNFRASAVLNRTQS